MEDSGSTFRHLPFLLASKQHSLINGKSVFFFYIWQPCLVFHFWRFCVFPLALLTSASGFLSLSTKFSRAWQPFLVFHCWHELAPSLYFPALRTLFMFPALDSSFKFPRAFQQVLARLYPFCVFPPAWLASLFLLSSLAHLSITQPSFVLSRNAAALTSPKWKRNIVLTRQVTAC